MFFHACVLFFYNLFLQFQADLRFFRILSLQPKTGKIIKKARNQKEETVSKLTYEMDPSRIPGDIDTPLHRLDHRFGYGKADPVPAPVCALSGAFCTESRYSARRYGMRLILSVKPFKKAGIICVFTFCIIVGYRENGPFPAARKFDPDGSSVIAVLDGIVNKQ